MNNTDKIQELKAIALEQAEINMDLTISIINELDWGESAIAREKAAKKEFKELSDKINNF